jgi:hypothetical protein
METERVRPAAPFLLHSTHASTQRTFKTVTTSQMPARIKTMQHTSAGFEKKNGVGNQVTAMRV